MRWAFTDHINWKRSLGKWSFKFRWRKGDGLMGRFGGGWHWKLGVQAGKFRSPYGTSVIFSLLVAEFTVRYQRLHDKDN